ncbi:hypothetical protein BUALT_Bualt10G0045800 [Buddleja alternifolia]|uniref:Uncharacterized protein n=1 Tax=Buddleja alternifolia TaxID=168488 RepID=A0AAV6X6T0_9LAMI|nr:hypothetical protein BUALT_Bualt10G0045800 [Buddleja alternifolia]
MCLKSPVHNFFTKLTFIVNLVNASSKRHDQLRDAQASIIDDLIANNELETGSGLNQIGTLQRVSDTRWSSHMASIRSILKMYDATYSVLQSITKEGNYSQRGDAHAACDAMTSHE